MVSNSLVFNYLFSNVINHNQYTQILNLTLNCDGFIKEKNDSKLKEPELSNKSPFLIHFNYSKTKNIENLPYK
jgi:hypothetical protein